MRWRCFSDSQQYLEKHIPPATAQAASKFSRASVNFGVRRYHMNLALSLSHTWTNGEVVQLNSAGSCVHRRWAELDFL